MDKLFQEIKLEYKKIDRKWLIVHHRLLVIISLMAIILEIVIGRILDLSGYVHIPFSRYILKYIAVPSGLNIIFIILSTFFVTSKKIRLKYKICAVSIIMVLQSFVLFTIHGSFVSLYFIFALPIVLTSIYGRYRVTITTGILSLTGFIYSELFLRWDGDKIGAMEDRFVLSSFILSIIVIIVIFAVSLTIIHFDKEKTNSAVRKEIERYKLRKRVQIDDLTKLYNRIALRKAIDGIERDCENHYHYVMIDIDNFKLLNDTYGHLAGDKCLLDLAEIMMKVCGGNSIYRYGGDEFSIIFKNMEIGEIRYLCNLIRNEFKAVSLEYKNSENVSLSFGISRYVKGVAPSEMIKKADEALYCSKVRKDCITIS